MANLHDICDFVKKLNQKLNLGDTIDVTEGKKFFKLTLNSAFNNSLSTYCFVDKNNGDIVKQVSATLSKFVRGNIFNDNPTECCKSYGLAELKIGRKKNV